MTFSSPTRWSEQRRFRGFTLVELLVALAVITILAGIALPATKSMLKEQRVSRGATLLQTAIQEGRSRAILAGGGGGIIIDRVGVRNVNQRSESLQMRFASSPPLYRGEPEATLAILGARNLDAASTERPNSNALLNQYVLWYPPEASQIRRSGQDILQDRLITLINAGDELQLGSEGLPFRIAEIRGYEDGPNADQEARRDAIDDALDVNFPPGSAINRRWTRVSITPVETNTDLNRFVNAEFSYAIKRQPTPAIAQPITMPKGTSIDLTASGVGRTGNQFSPFAIGTPVVSGVPQPNYVDTSLPPFSIPAALTNTNRPGQFDYESIYILFGSRGEVSRVLVGRPREGASAAELQIDPIVLTELDVTGDIYFLVNETGFVKTDPNEQFEDQEGRSVAAASDVDPLLDNADDGTTPLLNTDSIWVVIRARSGEVIASPWVNPTKNGRTLVPYYNAAVTPTNDQWRNRVQSILTLTRSAAAELRDLGAE